MQLKKFAGLLKLFAAAKMLNFTVYKKTSRKESVP